MALLSFREQLFATFELQSRFDLTKEQLEKLGDMDTTTLNNVFAAVKYKRWDQVIIMLIQAEVLDKDKKYSW